MPEFKSLVVFDSETTSMPHLDHNTTKIIELAFLGCEIEHLINEKKLPRVLHKLVLLFCPNKLISPGATDASGLTNELLENVQPFSEEDARIMDHFLKRLPQPVCIVAHNGNKFDFRILRKMLQKVNKNFSDDVFCADSLLAFWSIYPKSNNQKLDERSWRGEVTPKKQKVVSSNSLNYKCSRELFPEHEAFSKACENEILGAITPLPDSPTSYRLKDMYYFLFNKNFAGAHRAENDAIALLECLIQCEEFINWMNDNAVLFNEIPPI